MSDVAPVGGSKTQLGPSVVASSSLPPPPPSSAAPLLPPSGGDTEDDEGMKHLQQVGTTGGTLQAAVAEMLNNCNGKHIFNFVYVCVFRRQRRWWHHCRILLWRRSVSPRLCSSSRRAETQQLLCRCHMRLRWSGSTRTRRERSRVHTHTPWRLIYLHTHTCQHRVLIHKYCYCLS